MIVLDLEWNNGYDRKHIDEILQIGAVRLTGLDEPIADTFCAYIRPVIHKKCSLGAKHLPELQQSLDSELDFPAAYAAFRAWCGEETVFAQWGGDDFRTLRANCEYWDLPALEPEKTYDFQWAFSAMLDEERQVRLCDAVEYLRFPATFCFHNALNDAVYTAMVGAWMGEKRAFAEKQPKQKKKRGWVFSALKYPKQPKLRVGPLASRTAVLNARAGRKPCCPVCREKGLVNTWYHRDEQVYYGPFRCGEHGAFLSRLTLSTTAEDGWLGLMTVPVLTPELLRDFESAFGANSHTCRSQSKRRKKKNWYAWRARKKIS